MTDDLSKTIEQFKDLLNKDNAAETLKILANLINTDTRTETQQKSTKETTIEQELLEDKDISNKINTIIKIKKAYDQISRTEDKRVNLLTALKPYLSPKRVSTIDNAIKVIHLSKLNSIINELNL